MTRILWLSSTVKLYLDIKLVVQLIKQVLKKKHLN